MSVIIAFLFEDIVSKQVSYHAMWLTWDGIPEQESWEITDFYFVLIGLRKKKRVFKLILSRRKLDMLIYDTQEHTIE